MWQESEERLAHVRGSACAKVSSVVLTTIYPYLHFGQSEKVTEKTPIPPPDWEALTAQIANEIIEEHSPARILQVRAKLYDLLSHCIPATTILKVGLPHIKGF